MSLRKKVKIMAITSPKFRRRSQCGFTVIEMLVASMVLVIGAVAALNCISMASSSARISSEYSDASNLARKQFADLSQDLTNLNAGETSGNFNDDYRDFRWSQNVETTEIQSLYKVTINIEWQSGSRSNSIPFVTYVIKPPPPPTGTG